jgi:hypothetical protein
MLLGVIQPVARSTCADCSPKLVCFAPDQLFYMGIPPLLQTMATYINRSTSDPKEKKALALEVDQI